MTDWLNLVMGPTGALALALAAVLLVGRELRRRHAAEVQRLRQDLEAAHSELRTEHQGRLQDAKATTETLLQVTDRIHRTLDNLATLTKTTLRTPKPPSPP